MFCDKVINPQNYFLISSHKVSYILPNSDLLKVGKFGLHVQNKSTPKTIYYLPVNYSNLTVCDNMDEPGELLC